MFRRGIVYNLLPMPTDEQIVQAQVDSYNARDLERFINYYSPDIVILDGEGNQMTKGHESMRQLYAGLFEQSPKLHAEIKTRITSGQYIIDEERITGFNLKGSPSEMHAAVVYRISDGKITRVQMFL